MEEVARRRTSSARCRASCLRRAGQVEAGRPGADRQPHAGVFGPDRVMFGGDWPVCTLAATYRQWVEALKAIVANRSEEQRQKLFHDNAMRFYELK